MKNTIVRNFKSRFLPSFNNERIANLYYKSIYSFWKMLMVSSMTYCLVIVNMILLYSIKENNSKTATKHLQIFLLILEGVAIFSFITWSTVVDRLTKNKLFFWINFTLSAMNLFNIFLQPLILRHALQDIASSFVLNSIIPDIQIALITLYLLFIDNSFFMYLVDLILSIVLVYSLKIVENTTENIYAPSVVCVGAIFFISVAYFSNKRDRNYFTLHNKAISDIEKKKSLFDNLNSGLITIDEDGFEYNSKIKEYLNRNFENSTIPDQNLTLNKSEIKNNNDTFSNLNNNTSENFQIKSLLLRNYREYNASMDKNVKEIFERSLKQSLNEDNEEKEEQYDRMLKDLLNMMRKKENFRTYFYVGDKSISKSIKSNTNIRKDSSISLRIYMRYNNVSSSLEFFFNDISSVIEVENMKASHKYKKLFLNKFSHEFKNPLLNIMQLASNIKKGKKQYKNNCCNHSLISENNNSQHNYTENKAKSIFYRKFIAIQTDRASNKTNNSEDIKEIKYIKDSTMHLISLIEDFDFISNGELKLPITEDKTHNFKPQLNSPIGQSFIELSKFRLAKIIRQCVSILQTKIDLSEKNIKVTSKIDENIPYEIFSDYRRLKQVITNLLSNALKFTIMGEISITVRKDALNDNLINFEICDTGMGFREDILQMIQEGNTHLLFGNINTGGNIYGCGIGLELVENIISRIGKNFKISSKMNEGSIITFSIDTNNSRKKEIAITHKLNTTQSSAYFNKTNLNENLQKTLELPSPAFLRKISRQRSFSENKSYNFSLSPTNKQLTFKAESSEEIKNKFITHKVSSNDSLHTYNINNDNHLELELKKEKMPENNYDPLTADCKVEIINCNENFHKENESQDDENDKTIIINHMLELNADNRFEINSDKDIELSIESYKNNVSSKTQKNVDNDESLSFDWENKINSRRIKNSSRFSNKMNSKNENFKKIRILLVDDEKFIRQSEANQIKKFFKSKPNYQYEITECSDGVECLYNIYKGMQEGIKYDYIITDESMNFMRGTGMIKILNTLIGENIMYRLNTFMVTSYEPWAIMNTHGNICDGVISKPLTFENLTKIFSL